ncbi:phosphate ABC transporter permease PstA [Sphingomonas lacunae]|uniref:Phosphate transport system permease protein PstA n=1 Tax=Sphingomonas lacunae TaxID=2698828 RepID=A0A6M4AZX5_9SPHN|nr:phosphate ABC transporter permease PstA [Sphingomonas lacunae]QJQ33669.1 phosphate ABC transporter permease PstA [Sphingomonas lacunae]
MQARIRRRYRAERRFKAFGLTAVALSAGFLLFLLVTMAGSGLSGFTQTRVALPIDFRGSGLSINLDSMTVEEAQSSLAQQGLGDLVNLAATGAYGAQGATLFGPGAERVLRDAIIDDPSMLQRQVTIDLPAASAIDVAAKGEGEPAAERAVAQLEEAGKLSTGLDTLFLSNADATDPTMSGIWGALKGSLLTMLVCFAIAFPVGTLAALYLEEYAPRNRLTDIIEVSINNLAAVPSIIFGLLALALFINLLGICQGSPLVGGLTLALMTMPVIVIAGRNAIKSVPPSIRDAALGVGASKAQVVFHHVLPLALPGILTGTIIGMARALGETAPLLLVGMRAFVGGAPSGVCDSATVLPMQIYLWSDEIDRGFVENTSAAIIVLLVVLLSMNTLAIILRNRFEKRW